MKGLVSLPLPLGVPIFAAPVTNEPLRAPHAVVASVSEIASGVGTDVMKKGGNAIDATVAVAFALQVVWPEAGNIGGGGGPPPPPPPRPRRRPHPPRRGAPARPPAQYPQKGGN